MKKILASALIALVSTSALAGGAHRHHHDRGNRWAPLIIGGLIGYGISQSQQRERVIVVEQPPVYNNPPVVYNTPRTPVYRQVQRWNVDCNCFVYQYEQIGWQ